MDFLFLRGIIDEAVREGAGGEMDMPDSVVRESSGLGNG